MAVLTSGLSINRFISDSFSTRGRCLSSFGSGIPAPGSCNIPPPRWSQRKNDSTTMNQCLTVPDASGRSARCSFCRWIRKPLRSDSPTARQPRLPRPSAQRMNISSAYSLDAWRESDSPRAAWRRRYSFTLSLIFLTPDFLARVASRDHLRQITDLHARVDFRRRQFPMAQQLLDLANVRVFLQQVRRARVAQRMRCDPLLDPGPPGRLAHYPQQVVV